MCHVALLKGFSFLPDFLAMWLSIAFHVVCVLIVPGGASGILQSAKSTTPEAIDVNDGLLLAQPSNKTQLKLPQVQCSTSTSTASPLSSCAQSHALLLSLLAGANRRLTIGQRGKSIP